MTYNTVADITDSASLTRRIVAAAATEDIPNPEAWANGARWKLAAQPGWGQAWESAVASGVEDPGASEVVITDGMILSAVQAITTPVPPPVVTPTDEEPV